MFNNLVITALAHHETEEQTAFGQFFDDKRSQELKLKLIAEHDSLRRAIQVAADTGPRMTMEGSFGGLHGTVLPPHPGGRK